MIVVNARFYRSERRRRGYFQTVRKAVIGVELALDQGAPDALVRELLLAKLPEYRSWTLDGYAVVEPGREPQPVKVT